jgi:hypothetical protein
VVDGFNVVDVAIEEEVVASVAAIVADGLLVALCEVNPVLPIVPTILCPSLTEKKMSTAA